MIDIKNKIVTIIGGGKVAFRKAKKVLEFGGKVNVISPEFTGDFKKLKEEFSDKIELIKDKYKDMYIEKSFLVIGATSDGEVNMKVSNYCRDHDILCNIVDNINVSDFIIPSSVRRGSLVISISTMGKSPMLASKIKKEIEDIYSKDYDKYVDELGRAREIILEKYSGEEKREMLKRIIDMSLEEIKEFIEKEV